MEIVVILAFGMACAFAGFLIGIGKHDFKPKITDVDPAFCAKVDSFLNCNGIATQGDFEEL